MKKPNKPVRKLAKAAPRPSVAARPSIAERALAGIREAGAHARGEVVAGIVVHHPVDVKAVRAKVKMSQVEFSNTFGFSVGAVRDWEQGRAMPERAAATLMRVIEIAPDIARRAAKAA